MILCEENTFPAWLSINETTNCETMSGHSKDEDAQRMAAIAKGDDQALKFLIERWRKPLISFFMKSCGSLQDSEELAQVTFIRIYRAAPRYEPTAKFSTYLFHVARRLLINHYRSKSRKPATPTAPDEMPEMTSEYKEERNIREWEEIFQQALETLPEKQKTAILLLKQQGLSYDEIASIMNISLSNVKTLIFRARKEIKDFFDNQQ